MVVIVAVLFLALLILPLPAVMVFMALEFFRRHHPSPHRWAALAAFVPILWGIVQVARSPQHLWPFELIFFGGVGLVVITILWGILPPPKRQVRVDWDAEHLESR